MLFNNDKKVTLPDCVKKIDLGHFANCKELHCSTEAEYSYYGKHNSKNPKEVLSKLDDYHKKPYSELTINGVKVLD